MNSINAKSIREAFEKVGNYEFRLKNFCMKGSTEVGCRGFIQNKDTDKIAYIDTTTVEANGHIMYGSAKTFGDYPAYHSIDHYQWCQRNDIVTCASSLLGDEKTDDFAKAVTELTDGKANGLTMG